MTLFLRFFIYLLPVVAIAQNFPTAKKDPQTISRHNITFIDDYAWMHNLSSPDLYDWVKAQNKITDSHNNLVSKSVFSLPTIKKYNAKTHYSVPYANGKYYYTFNAKGIAYRSEINSLPVVLVNANFFYNDKVVSIDESYPSNTSKHLAYTLSVNGSDSHELRFVTVDNGKHLNDIIKNVKFTNISWRGDEGVFYKKNSNSSQFGIDSTYQMFYHKIGTNALNDIKVFDTSDSKNWFYFFSDETNEKLFVVEQDRKTKTENLFLIKEGSLDAVKIAGNIVESLSISGTHKNDMFFSSTNSNWGDVQYFNTENIKEKKVLIPESNNQLLTDTYFYENKIVCKYRNNEGSYLAIYDYNGKLIKKVQGPKGMDITVYGKNYMAKEIFFSLHSLTIPPLLFRLDISTGSYERYITTMFPKATAPFGIDYFETKKTSYTSRDGVQIPITLVYKKGTVLNGSNPTLLESYGGFGAVKSSHYDNGKIYFIEKGGVYAYAEIRGGGENGKNWHKEGRGLKKINSLNDFIDAAEFLIKEKYTSPQKLGITGASHGGLVVANAMIERPDLFKVAIPKVGVYDMCEKFNYTNANLSMSEYGNPENKDEYMAMMDYSPYHNIKNDVNYPITLIIASQNDDRVPPFQSYKFAAKLQNRTAQKNPVYLKAIQQAGHYGIMSNFQEFVEDQSEFYSFLLYHLTK